MNFNIPLLSLFLSLAGIAGAQNGLEVTGFQLLANDMTARTIAPERDANGELTAVIKVVTSETGFDFEAGSLGISKVTPKTGEYWVYVPAKSRNITIKHPRLGILRNYAYPLPITAGSVYEMKLVHGELEVTIKERQILTEYVIITSEPSGADVYLNNEPVGKTSFTAEKEEGRYEWRVVRDLYLPEAGVFELKAGEKQKLDVTLNPDFGTLEITTLPEEGASITINGFKTGQTTPAKLEEVPSGEQSLTLTHEWYETTTQKVNVVAGKAEPVRITMQPNFAELTVEAKADEEVFVNDSRKGVGKWTGRLSPGVYRIEVRKAGHSPATRQLTLSRGDRESVRLAPEPILSNLKVVSEPIEAEIFLNGERKGATPHILRDLLVGDYKLELRKTGYGTSKQTVTVKEGEVVEVNMTLSSTGSLAFTSEPAGADVYLNGSYKGRTPYTATDLPSGNYSYELRKEGYETFKGSSVVDAGKTSQVYRRLTSSTGSLTFTSEPSGADVYLNGSYKGRTPYTATNLPSGNYSYELRKDGYETFKGRGMIDAGKASQVSKTLISRLKRFRLEMVLVEGGTFKMGCTSEQSYCDNDEMPAQRVKINSFEIGKYEVTQAQWRAVMGSNPSKFSGCDNCPVEQVSWNDIQDFIRKLNQQTGKNYRLPTEAEWEYAARGGNKSKGYKYPGSNDIGSVAWYSSNSSSKTHPVGQKRANELGIYDMSGNVWEWCEDWYGKYSSAGSTNSKDPTRLHRVLRGGSCDSFARGCRVSNRDRNLPGARTDAGFRLVLPSP